MMFFVRTIESAVYPVGLIWIGLTVGAFVLWRKKQRGASKFCAIFSVFLFLTGATPVPEYLLARLERPYAEATVKSAASADAIIVLGGFINASTHDTFGMSMTPAADRILTGVELLREKKGRALIIGGGGIGRGPNRGSEGERVAEFVRLWNPGSGEVIGLPPCGNTHDEAKNVQAIAAERHWTNLILVTSAYHMPRALATFQKAGVGVHPVACDFEALPVLEKEGTSMRLIPILEHLQNLTLYLHEVIGWYYYGLRGWV